MENISITIEKEQLEWLENQVKEGRFANISHGVRFALKKLIEEKRGEES